MVIVSCPAAGTQPTAGNWSGPRAQRNKGVIILIYAIKIHVKFKYHQSFDIKT